ncbi:MAG: RNase adapter RapZ [Pseudomonadota bacterium]
MTNGTNNKRRLIIVTGLSGAGKTVALHALEDLSFYTIDNLPISLLNTFIGQLINPNSKHPQKIAIGIDARNSLDELTGLPETIAGYKNEEIIIELIYLDASNEVLTKRYSETRRKHPLSSDKQALVDAINQERDIMSAFSESADFRIDTSRMVLHELRELVRARIAREDVHTLSIQVMSFGFKHGLPADSDFIFDMRALPNPYWEKDLRNYSGIDKQVVNYLSQQTSVKTMFEDLTRFFDHWIPQFEKDNRSYLSIALGCTGGQHRSVYMTEKLAEYFLKNNKQVLVRHRDI